MEPYFNDLINKVNSPRYKGQLPEIRKYLNLYIRNKKVAVTEGRAAMVAFGVVCTILCVSVLIGLGVLHF